MPSHPHQARRLIRGACWLVILGSLWVVFRTVPVGLLFAELQAWIETLGAWGPLVFAAI